MSTSRDNASCKKVLTHVAAQAITATNTPAAGVDTTGFNQATFLISVGTITNIANSPQPAWTFKVQESDTVSSGYADIVDSRRILVAGIQSPGGAPDSGTGVFLTIDAAAEDATTYHVGVITEKQYARVVATAANTPGSTPYSVVCVLEGGLEPVSN